MESLSTPCIFCGSDRPLASETCPTCGRGWIDTRIPSPKPDVSAPGEGGHVAPHPSVADEGSRRDAESQAPVAPAPAPSPIFSDSNDTGLRPPEEAGDDARARTPEPTERVASSGNAGDGGEESGGATATAAADPTPAAETAVDQDEATSMFAAVGAADEVRAGGPDVGETRDEPRDAAPDEAATQREDQEDSSDPLALEPAAPDELGIIPVVSATGPPEYLPEPERDEPIATGDSAGGEPRAAIGERTREAPRTVEPADGGEPADEGDDATSTVEHSEDADRLTAVPIVETPAAGATPPTTTSDVVATPTAAGAVPSQVDPDGLIEDVFGEELVDGRPPSATDDMLDDVAAWSAFAGAQEPASAPAAQAAEPAGTSTAPVSGSFPGEHPDESPFFTSETDAAPSREPSATRRRWSQTAIVAVIVLSIIGLWLVVLAWITSDDDSDTVASPTTQGETASTVTETTLASETTAASSTSSTTSTTTTTLAPIEPVGEAIALADLGLGAFALGPIDFGATDALGRLVATLDQPDSITDASGALGLCADDTGFAADWGPFSAIFIGAPSTNVFVGYRLDTDGDHPTSGLATLSGVQVGDSIADLEETYASFEISYEEIGGALHFILVRQSDSTTLLWGPVTSSDSDGVVQGIYSPETCTGGPTPSG